MPVEIRPITYGDIPGAARCIQEAFADDPYHKWVFDKSQVWNRSYLHFMTAPYLPYISGEFYVHNMSRSSSIRSVTLVRSPSAASGEFATPSSMSPKTRLPRLLIRYLALLCGHRQFPLPRHQLGQPRSTPGPSGFARASSISASWAAAACV